MNDKEKLQYLYDKEKEKEKKQEKKQGQVLFAGGMVGYLIIATFKIVVMSFFPLLFFYFIFGIGGMSLIILSLIAGAVFFYIREGKDIKEDMVNRALMKKITLEEFTSDQPSYLDKELIDDTTEVEEKKMEDKLEGNFAGEQKKGKELIPEEKKDNKKSLFIQKSIINANRLAIISESDKALNNIPAIISFLKQYELKNAKESPYLNNIFYEPITNSTEEFEKVVLCFEFSGATTQENNKDILESWEKELETESEDDIDEEKSFDQVIRYGFRFAQEKMAKSKDDFGKIIFNQAIREAMQTARRESYSETIRILGDLKEHFDYHSEEEWRNHVSDMEEKELQNIKGCGARLLTESEKRKMGLIL